MPLLESERLRRNGEENGAAEGHLSHSWVVAVAVSLGESKVSISYSPPLLTLHPVMIILALTVTVVIVTMRQRRKRSRSSRRRRDYSRTSDEPVAALGQPYKHVWRGPYTSRASYNRSPSPVSR